LNPVAPEAYGVEWQAGLIMSKTDSEVSDGPNHLDNPAWLVPLEASHWAPLQGMFYSLRGTDMVSAAGEELAQKDITPWDRQPPRLEAEPGGPVEQLWTLYNQAKVELDTLKRYRLVWDMVKVHVDHGPFFMGAVANYPRIVLVREGLKNVPRREDLPLGGYVNTWIHPTPAAYDPEAYYWENPEEHA
jgi:peptide/nickel transport system substrate-binding protein